MAADRTSNPAADLDAFDLFCRDAVVEAFIQGDIENDGGECGKLIHNQLEGAANSLHIALHKSDFN